MNNRKLAIIGAAVLVIICCVLAAGCTAEDSTYQPARVYDLENHAYTSEFMDYLQTRTDCPYIIGNTFYYRDGMTMDYSAFPSFNNGSGNVEQELLDLGEGRVATMDTVGITTALVSPSEGIEELDKENAVKYARQMNDAVAEAAKKYPGRILGTITLPTPYVEESIAELERCVNELDLQYWHTHSNYGGETLADEKFEPLLAKCAELNVPIYLHPAYPSNEYLLESGLAIASAGFGFSVDSMKTLLELISGGTFDRYPNLQMIIGHIGEYFPYALERMDNRFTALKSQDPTVKCTENISYYFKNGNIFMTT
ncbi:MAG TPA: amidohydrolase family protein, partial [Methanocorpusculum sp.]|nr:amidohydrolase family protein [Methanocorpusculum sp.]